MAASPCAEPRAAEPGGPMLDEHARSLLLDIADAAVVAGLDGRTPDLPNLASLPQALREPCGVFVTLFVDGRLNGCVGSIATREPLGAGTARGAWNAAFDDPRLPSLQWRDYGHLTIEISVVSPLSRLGVESYPELVAALRPGVDGLYLCGAGRSGVFLPSVWERVPDAEDFVRHLQAKAGLPPGSWPPGMRAYRFTATKFSCRAGRVRTSPVVGPS
jgi:AmmeMemoRadiSam system protein A